MPNVVTFICILKACGNEGAVEIGRDVHAKIIYSHLENENFITKALVDMYSKCGMIAEAQGLFHTLSNQIVYLSTSPNSRMKNFSGNKCVKLSLMKSSLEVIYIPIF